METSFEWITHYGSVAIFLLLMLGIVGLPVPDETLLTFIGYLSFKGTLSLGPTWAAAVLGSTCGITLSYGLGRLLGRHVVTRLSPYVHLRSAHLAVAERWFERWGKYTLVFCYFVPGVRHLAAVAAGTSHLPLSVFASFAYAGALVWTSSYMALGYLLGEKWTGLAPLLHRTVIIWAVMVALGLMISLLLIQRRASTREPNQPPR
jgi:membrane protein DedA with SNARE-associated domain